MGTLLHLSDLHLTGSDNDDVIGDYKVDAIPHADRQRRTSVIADTLRQLGLGLSDSGIDLDAVVITGDVAYRGAKEGFDLLDEVLGELGTALPPREKILVLPGNHDVAWGTDPGSAERYSHFVALRERGFRTTYLEGIDLKPNGDLKAPEEPILEPMIAAADNSFVVIGVNSSDASGVQALADSELEPQLDLIDKLIASGTHESIAVGALLKSWRARGQYDIARITRAQRNACNRILARHRAELAATSSSEPVAIAAFHHQLLPVSSEEEFKPFESMVNHGEVREWLQRNNFDILLHGHKHTDRVSEDIFVPFGEGNHSSSHRLLVVSAPTIGHGQPASGPVARLIRINQAFPRLSPASFKLVRSGSGGLPIDVNSIPAEDFTVGDTSSLIHGVIEGKTAADVYDRIASLCGQYDQIPRPLVCRILNGESARTLPENYPDRGSDGDETEASRLTRMQKWSDNIVDWWQTADPGAAAQFNHGERIRRPVGSKASQFHTAIENLRADTRTSRAVMLLIDPDGDFNEPDSVFPAFVLVQIIINEDLTIDVTGYFRKQEMPHWWPINVAELARVQTDVVDELNVPGRDFRPGGICTVTAMPVTGPTVPRVAIPEIDRRADNSAAFLALLVPLFYGGVSSSEMQVRWHEIIDDWVPSEKYAADGDPVPLLGLAKLFALADELNRLSPSYQADATALGSRLVSVIRQLREGNELYAQRQRGPDRSAHHQQWQARVRPLVDELFEIVKRMADSVG